MAARYLLALDLGTSRVRCHLFTLKGRLTGSSSLPMTVKVEADVSPLAQSFDPEALWRSLCQLIRRTLREAGATGKEVRAVSATSQRESLVFLDGDGREVYAGPNTDLRATFEGLALDERLGAAVYSVTGHQPSFLLALGKLKWFQQNRPGDFGRIAAVLPLADWALSRLSGELLSQRALAAESGLVDIATGQRAARLYADAGLPNSLLPPIGDAGARTGTVRPAAARQTGLAPGTAVVLGGPDTQCGLLGMNITDVGQAGVVTGWSAPVQLVLGRPVLDPAKSTWTGCHLLPRRWVLDANAGESGGSYRWLLRLLFGSEDADAHRRAERLAAKAPPGAGEAVALLGARPFNMDRLGLSLGGLLFPVPMTVQTVDQGHLVRAALESVAFAIRGSLERLEQVGGQHVQTIALGGGFARSRLFPSLLADVLGREVRRAAVGEVSGLGAAICAATGAGVYASLAEAVEVMGARLQAVAPRVETSQEYNRYYLRWKRVCEALGTVSPEVL